MVNSFLKTSMEGTERNFRWRSAGNP